MGNENINVFGENNGNNHNSSESINSNNKELAQEQVNLDEIDVNKYINMAKEIISSKCKVAVEKSDLESLIDAKREIEKLEKVENNRGFLGYISNTVNDLYRILTNKEKKYESKSESELKEQKKLIKKSIDNTKGSYNHLKSVLSKVKDELINSKNKISESGANLKELDSKIIIEEKKFNELGLAIEKISDETYKTVLIQLKDSMEINLDGLKTEKVFAEDEYELAIDNRNLYLMKKNDLMDTIKSFDFNLKFYDNEIREIDVLIKEQGDPFLENKLKGEIGAYISNNVKLEIAERTNKKIVAYNQAKSKQPSLGQLHKSYYQKIKSSPKIKK